MAGTLSYSQGQHLSYGVAKIWGVQINQTAQKILEHISQLENTTPNCLLCHLILQAVDEPPPELKVPKPECESGVLSPQ
jgi:hypothetical protein